MQRLINRQSVVRRHHSERKLIIHKWIGRQFAVAYNEPRNHSYFFQIDITGTRPMGTAGEPHRRDLPAEV